MKLVRFGPAGAERPGLLLDDDAIADLSGVIDDISGDALSPSGLDLLRGLDAGALPRADRACRIGPPVAGTRSFICVGLNYTDHAAESGMAAPSEPVVFFKSTGSIVGPHDDLVLPEGSRKTDWEVELAIVIGSRARMVKAIEAMRFVAGYMLLNDVSEREWQLDHGGSWSKGKSFDGFGQIGPWLVTADEIPDPHNIALELRVNDEVMQSSSTSKMIFKAAHLVAYVSAFMTLRPGDIIATGTPAGVGMGRRPERYLCAGENLELDGGPLGRQVHRVVAGTGID